MPTRSELEAAYRATTYQVFLPAGRLDLRIGIADPALAAWLQQEDVASWALLTACNPGAARLSDSENNERQSALEVALLERGFEPYAGEHIADAADWPAEQSCLVPHISLAEALGFARQFQQNAILHGVADGVPQLVWVTSDQGGQEE